MTSRKCRQCNDILPASRYFNCHKCQSSLPEIDDAFIYHTEELDEYTSNMADGLFDDLQSRDDSFMEEVENEENWVEGDNNGEDNSSEEIGQDEWDIAD